MRLPCHTLRGLVSIGYTLICTHLSLHSADSYSESLNHHRIILIPCPSLPILSLSHNENMITTTYNSLVTFSCPIYPNQSCLCHTSWMLFLLCLYSDISFNAVFLLAPSIAPDILIAATLFHATLNSDTHSPVVGRTIENPAFPMRTFH